jgi:hypothetical protein
MSRMGRRAKAKRTKQIVFGTIAFLFVAIIVSGAGYYVMTRPKPLNATNMCPANGPIGQYVILIDKTDPLTFTQKAALEVVVKQLVDKRVPQGYLVSVFALGANYKENAEPVVELCNPGNDAGKDENTSNLRRLRQQYEKKFAQPLKAQIDNLIATESAKISPIFEMLQIVAINGFRKHNINGERRLLVISDMLHNTEELSMFKERPEFSTLFDSAYGRRIQLDLGGVEVELHYLMNYPQFQTKRNAKFWEDYFEKAGAHVVDVRPLEG